MLFRSVSQSVGPSRSPIHTYLPRILPFSTTYYHHYYITHPGTGSQSYTVQRAVQSACRSSSRHLLMMPITTKKIPGDQSTLSFR